MNFMEQLAAVTLFVDFFLGVVLGVVGGAAWGSLREDNEKSLLRTPPDRLSGGARTILGVYTGDDGYLATLLSGGSRGATTERGERGGGDAQNKGSEQ